MPVFEDRLSPLADGLLLHILSLTESYKTAVVCSVLSKRWRTLYTQLPSLSLKFMDIFGDLLGDETLFPQIPSNFVLLEELLQIVTRALLVHSQNLETLSLDAFPSKVEGIRKSFKGDWANDWLENAAARNVQNLSLFNLSAGKHVGSFPYLILSNIPNHLFSCTSLVTLHLSRFAFFNLDSCSMYFNGFPHLKSCTMEMCNIHDLTTFLDNCPVLQTLELLDCKADSDLTISSKSLLVLNIRTISGPYEHYEIIVECPQLVHIYGNSKCQLQFERLSRLGSLPSSLYHAQLSENGDLISVGFDLSDPDCSDVSYMFSMIRTTTFSTLKAMELSMVETYPASIWIAISGLPLLCTLNLTYCIFLGNENDYNKSEISDNMQLREAHVRLRNTSPGEMQMIFLLTQKCPMLRTLVLTLHDLWMRNNDAGYLKILTELLSNQTPGQHLQLEQFKWHSQIKITKQP